MLKMIKVILIKLFPRNLAGILGIIQLVIPAIREVIMATLRLLAIFTPEEITKELIAEIKKNSDALEKRFDDIKRFLFVQTFQLNYY